MLRKENVHKVFFYPFVSEFILISSWKFGWMAWVVISFIKSVGHSYGYVFQKILCAKYGSGAFRKEDTAVYYSYEKRNNVRSRQRDLEMLSAGFPNFNKIVLPWIMVGLVLAKMQLGNLLLPIWKATVQVNYIIVHYNFASVIHYKFNSIPNWDHCMIEPSLVLL